MSPGSTGRGASVLVVVPCLNEEPTVGRVVAATPRAMSGVASVRVVVIDDGSSDRSAEVARAAGAEVVSHGTNRGLGATFRQAMRLALESGADVLVHIDGDGQFDPAHIPRLVAPVVEGRAGMVSASRFLDPALVPAMSAAKRWGNRAVARIVELLTGARFQDVSCGFRAFSREALLRLNLFGSFTYTQETFLELAFKEVAIAEIPLPVRGTREFGTSRMAASLPRYAIRSLQIMLRAFISYRPFRFFSSVAAVFLASGLALLGFLLVHYLRSGHFSPHIWAGFVGGSLAFVGIVTFVIGFIGDMLVHMRMNQEEMLYYLKKAHWTHREWP